MEVKPGVVAQKETHFSWMATLLSCVGIFILGVLVFRLAGHLR